MKSHNQMIYNNKVLYEEVNANQIELDKLNYNIF